MLFEPIVDVEYVKTSLNIKGNEQDARILQLIEEAEDAIREYTHNPYTDGLPISYRRNVVRMVEFDLNRKTGLSSEGLSRHSQGYAQDYPADIYKGLKRRLSW